jgi:LysR family cyn operon transcriptional activator
MVENLEWYRVFYFAAKTGSLTKAAEALFISQPAVTYSIKQLEESLGGQLFFRTTKGVTLTVEGQALFSYIEPAYNFIINGERKLAEMHQLMEGEIKIGAGDTLCKHYLLPYLEVFHETYPDIKIQVTNRTTLETIQLLKEGKLDFGIVNLPVEDIKLNIIQSMQIEDCFIVGEKYKALAENPHSLEQLSSYPLMLLERGTSTRSNLDRFANQLGVSLKPEIELGSIDLLIEFARTDLALPM